MNSINDQRRGPTEQRNFVHKRLFGAAEGFFSGGPAGAVSGFVRPRSSGSREAAVAVSASAGTCALRILASAKLQWADMVRASFREAKSLTGQPVYRACS